MCCSLRDDSSSCDIQQDNSTSCVLAYVVYNTDLMGRQYKTSQIVSKLADATSQIA